MPVDELIPIDKIPDELGFIKDGIVEIFFRFICCRILCIGKCY